MSYLEEMRKRFDERFVTEFAGINIMLSEPTPTEFKAFITAELQRFVEEAIVEIEKKKQVERWVTNTMPVISAENIAFNMGLSKAQSILKGMIPDSKILIISGGGDDGKGNGGGGH